MKMGFMSTDGEFFTSEEKCREHEDLIAQGWSGSGEVTIHFSNPYFIADSTFIFCPTTGSVAAVRLRAKEEGVPDMVRALVNPGLYCWYEDFNGFIPVDNYLDTMEQKIATAKALSKQLL